MQKRKSAPNSNNDVNINFRLTIYLYYLWKKKKELHQATALWVVSDMRLYTIVEDVGWTYSRIIFISRKAGKPRG